MKKVVRAAVLSGSLVWLTGAGGYAQTQSGNRSPNSSEGSNATPPVLANGAIDDTNTAVVLSSPTATPAMTPQDIRPAMRPRDIRPAMTPQDIRPVMPPTARGLGIGQ